MIKSIFSPRRHFQSNAGGLAKSLALMLAFGSILSTEGYSQGRPVLRPMNRSYFAGKLLLVPRDERPSSLQQPRLIAEVADHDLITPPVRLLSDPAGLDRWLLDFDFYDTDGVILSLERMADPAGNPRPAVFDFIRSRRPGLQVYAFIDAEGTDESQVNRIRGAMRLVDEGKVDLLLISGDRRAVGLAGQTGENSAGREGRIILEESSGSSTILLVGRMLNRRFGYSPRFLPVFSSNPSGPSADSETGKLANRAQNQIVARVRTLGGTMFQATQPARNPELVTYVYMPGTGDQERSAFIQSIGTALEKNLRVVLIDLSLMQETRQSLMALLRQSKLLDRISAYAARTYADEPVGDVVTRAIGQASSFLLAIRFLRDDLDRVRRIDRAQVRLLISRYLSDYFYPLSIREDLVRHARTDLNQPEIRTSDNRLLDYATERMRLRAEELFNEQFRRNIHATLLSNGERAQFEIRLLQRVQTRIYPSRAGSNSSIDIEVTPSVYLVHLGNLSTSLLPNRTYWELTGDIDDRILRRWDEINWLRFKVDAESVEMRIKIDEKRKDLPESNEGYAISNRLSRGKRRIEITARSPAGAYYALDRLEQLGIDDKLAGEFQLAEGPAVDERGVIDDFGGRWSDHDRADLMMHLGRLRMNAWYFLPEGPNGTDEIGEERLRALIRKAGANFLDFTVLISTVGRSDEEIAGQMSRLAARGVRRFGIPAGAGQPTFKLASEAARKLGAELKTVGNALPAGMCPWTASGSPASVVVRPGESPQLSLPGLATAADYAWQRNDFSVETSFTRAFQLLYDERSRKAVKLWNDLTGACSTENALWDNLIGAEDGAAGQIDVREAERLIEQLRDAVESISGTRDRGLLRGEFARQLAEAEKKLAGLKNQAPVSNSR